MREDLGGDTPAFRIRSGRIPAIPLDLFHTFRLRHVVIVSMENGRHVACAVFETYSI